MQTTTMTNRQKMENLLVEIYRASHRGRVIGRPGEKVRSFKGNLATK